MLVGGVCIFWGLHMENWTEEIRELSEEGSRRCAADISALRVSKQNYLFPSLETDKDKECIPISHFLPPVAFLFKLRRH